jgi:FkbM family methyltransferase
MIEEFRINGEFNLIDKVSKWIQLNTIFDVGANVGEWTQMLRHYYPEARIHQFEPMPPVYTHLIKTLDKYDYPNPFGLSESTEWLTMKFTPSNPKLTTPCLEFGYDDEEIYTLMMADGKNYCNSRRVDFIDLLKIDTEGHEMKVIKGFGDMLTNKQIAIIQFEYGYANVLTKDLLVDYWRLLNENYAMGKLHPDGTVEFREYRLMDEDFQGPNYVAVLKERTDIISVMSE